MAKILVIDDVEDVRLTVDVTLDLLGHEIVEAAHGGEGIEALEKDEFDLVITDLHMPIVDGTKVVEYVKGMERPPALIIMTGGGNKISSQWILGALDKDNHFILKKPFTGKELTEAVDTVLKNN